MPTPIVLAAEKVLGPLGLRVHTRRFAGAVGVRIFLKSYHAAGFSDDGMGDAEAVVQLREQHALEEAISALHRLLDLEVSLRGVADVPLAEPVARALSIFRRPNGASLSP